MYPPRVHCPDKVALQALLRYTANWLDQNRITASLMTIPKPLTITCTDGVKLAATLYPAKKLATGAIMLAPATGIGQRFYQHFAKFLSEQGFAVLTYDNRGIGESDKHKHIMRNASLQCWGELDMPAVLDTLKSLYPDIPLHLIGHSAGGQLVGLMPNSHQLHSFVTFGSSSGSLRNFDWPYKFKAHFYMNCFIPLTNLLFGQTQSQWVGMGEPLPRRVAAQWQKWCNGQGYVKTEFGKGVTRHYYDDLTQPSLWLTATDDEIARPQNVDEMLAVYSRIKAEKKSLNPTTYGLNHIGHMRFFSRQCLPLWSIASQWLQKQTA